MEIVQKHEEEQKKVQITLSEDDGKSYKVKVHEKSYIPDSLFATDNDMEIPVLDKDMQAKYCEIPFVKYGEQKKTFDLKETGTLHFYADDWKFDCVFNKPENILSYHPANIVEPNFSLYNETPVAFGMQQIYKKRWIARAMQERGIRVFVDLNVAPKWYKLNMLGVPMGWSSFCTRGYSDRLQYLEFEYEMAKAWAGEEKLLFVIYNGGSTCREFAKQHGCIYINPMVKVKEKMAKLNNLKDSIMFVEEEEKAENVMARSLRSIEQWQVQNFTAQLPQNNESKALGE